MKNLKTFLTISIIIFLCLQIFQCAKVEELDLTKSTKIGIVNPTAGSLRGFKNLVENKILTIPNLKIIAINYEKAERDIEAVQKFIDDDETNLFLLERIDGELSQNNLFSSNELTNEYKRLFEKTDGIIFLGGADFPPAIYESKTSLMTNISTPYRHYFELSFLFHLLGGYQNEEFIPLLENNPDFPVIGFCLGMQSINVATGGSMYQDIPMDIYGLNYVEDVLSLDKNQQHLNYWQKIHPNNQMIWANFHPIKSIQKNHFFDNIFWSENPTPRVYSSHHQAVKDLGRNIETIATSVDDKVVEIIAHKKYKNVIGVQFHPEVSSIYDPEGEKYFWNPEDTTRMSYYTYLQNTNSLKFHRDFWTKTSDIFSGQKRVHNKISPK